jgi:hypothetical protein
MDNKHNLGEPLQHRYFGTAKAITKSEQSDSNAVDKMSRGEVT